MTNEQVSADPRVHDLKVWPEFFEALVDGRKTFEIRKNDRGFRLGDKLRLQEFVPTDGSEDHPEGYYTGREVGRVITYMTDWEQRENFVVMGIRG